MSGEKGRFTWCSVRRIATALGSRRTGSKGQRERERESSREFKRVQERERTLGRGSTYLLDSLVHLQMVQSLIEEEMQMVIEQVSYSPYQYNDIHTAQGGSLRETERQLGRGAER
jgi:hypothetical protein